ncbi:MAG: single-stranded-DNA-specific exonuclease RecJ [Xanthomonadaceae bacterium]|nr:single-stranded-DNA-specific exonuclease RecJ [Xanthomonadaceae bacterium]
MKEKKQREWKLRTDSTIRIRETPEFLELLRVTGLSQVTLQVCWNRGLRTPETIREFFSPRFEHIQSPFTIKDMALTVERVIEAYNKKEKVRIFGDYDVDGTCGAALLYRVLTEFGINVDVKQPDRFKDGYGLNSGAIDEAVSDGVQLLITVDCGISSFSAIENANAHRLPVIIMDHHQIDGVRGLPQAYAILNPQRADCESGLKQLCGAGVAFYFCMGLRAEFRELGLLGDASALPNLKQHLDLVTIATAADQVPLTGVNRVFVKQGLDILKQSTKPGVKALMEVTGLTKRDLSPGHLGFTLGPRINASGRLSSAKSALDLLTTDSLEIAYKLAREIETLNEDRTHLQNEIWDQVQLVIEKGLKEGKFQHGILVGSPDWHEGVIGIVASRVCEKYHKPCGILSMREDLAKGSARTFSGRDVLSALTKCSGLLLGFGGHRHAAGFSLKNENLEALQVAFDDACMALIADDTKGALIVEGEAGLEEFSERTLEQLEQMAPFGNGNPEPVFVITAKVKNKRVMKERHLKLSLSPVGSTSKQTMEAVWFHQADIPFDSLNEAGDASFAGVPELNRFLGRSTPNFRIRDIRRLSKS